MKIISISNDNIFHDKIQKSLHIDIRVDESNIDKLECDKSDIVLFDVDELEDLLYKVILNVKVLCVARDLDELKGYKLLKKGANGYDNMQNLTSAIEAIKKNQVWIYPKLMSFIIKNSTIPIKSAENPAEKLSKKEFQVAKLVAQGLSNQEISDSLKITLRTVKAHVSSSFVKLNLKDRVALAMLIKEYFG